MRRWIPLALLLTAALAHAGGREFRALRDEVDALIERIERDRGDDAARLDEDVGKLRQAAEKLLAEDAAGAVEHLLERGVTSRARRASEVALAVIGQTEDGRATRHLVKAIQDGEPRTQVLLAGASADLEGEDVTRAFVRTLRDREDQVRAAAARALGARGAAARAAAEGALRSALRDDALHVRYAVAGALEALTGERPAGFPEPAAEADGLPSSFTIERVTFLLDETRVTDERAFEDPFAGPAEEGQGEGEAKLHSIQDVMVRSVLGAIERMGEGTRFQLVRFGGRTQSFARDFQGKPRRGLGEVEGWLRRTPRERDRAVLGALEAALRQDPPPQQVFLFLAGPPDGYRAASTAATIEGLKDALWGTGAAVHVTGYLAPPLEEPSSAQGRLELSQAQEAFRLFVQQLALAGGGASRVVGLSRPSGEGAESGGAAAAEAKVEDFPVDLTKPISTRELRQVQDGLVEARKKRDAWAVAFVEAVASCPDPKVVPLVLEDLAGADRSLAEAARQGLAKSPSPDAREEVRKVLADARSAVEEIRLLRAYGPASGGDVTAGLISALEDLEPDARRLAWRYLAERPAPELAEHQGRLQRPARDLQGLASFYAVEAQAKAAGNPAPPRTGLAAGSGRFLPDRFVASGVAFVVDAHRDAERTFWTPPPPEEGGEEEKENKRKKKVEPQPQPVSVLAAMTREVARALEDVAAAGAKTNVIPAGGAPWERSAAALEGRRLEDARAWVRRLSGGSERDVCAGLERALADPAVEEVYLLVSGLPLRSPGSREPGELAARIRAANAGRAVRIHVVYVLEPAPEEGLEAAARKDLLAAMDAVYKPLAEESEGSLEVRTSLVDLERPAGGD